MKKDRTTKRSKTVIQYDLNNNIIRIYDSISIAARHTGVKVQNIWKVCNGHNCSLGGFRFKYKD